MKINTIILIDKDQVKKQKFLEKLRKKITFSYTKVEATFETLMETFPEEKLNQIRKYDTKFDWTRNLSDEEALSLFDNHIKTSKRLQEEAQKYGFEFIDTSFERESKVKDFFDELIRSGKLERTDESYEKYYR